MVQELTWCTNATLDIPEGCRGEQLVGRDGSMTDGKMLVNRDWFQFQVHAALKDLCSGAERIRLIGTALERTAVEVVADTPPEGLREVATVVKTHALGVLMNALDVASGCAPRNHCGSLGLLGFVRGGRPLASAFILTGSHAFEFAA